jgi:hypothetical protein
MTAANDWPANAVPAAWVESLFEKMATIYGSRFHALWGDVDPHSVRKTWGVELAKLSPEQLRAGVHSLCDTLADPPTLPRFMGHCRAARQQQANAPQLTDQRRADPATQREGMQRFRDAVRPLAMGRSNPGSKWARDLLARGTGPYGATLTPEVRRVAERAVAHHATRGTHDDE